LFNVGSGSISRSTIADSFARGILLDHSPSVVRRSRLLYHGFYHRKPKLYHALTQTTACQQGTLYSAVTYASRVYTCSYPRATVHAASPG
jgi:hypothetical protein